MRIEAAVVALAFVLSSLAGLFHDATTVHVRCAQHGELIDGARATAERTTSEAPAELSALAGGDARRVAHGHEHCSLSSALRESRVMPRPLAIAPARIAVAELTVVDARAVTARVVALYRTAPKTSPPA